METLEDTAGRLQRPSVVLFLWACGKRNCQVEVKSRIPGLDCCPRWIAFWERAPTSSGCKPVDHLRASLTRNNEWTILNPQLMQALIGVSKSFVRQWSRWQCNVYQKFARQWRDNGWQCNRRWSSLRFPLRKAIVHIHMFFLLVSVSKSHMFSYFS